MGTSMSTHSLAAIHYERYFDIDELFIAACRQLAARGLRLGGIVQMSKGGVGGCATSVDLVDLRTGKAFDIWDDRGSCARGCRLDERGLSEAGKNLEKAIDDRVDLLVINRFGRAESLGRGLRRHFAQAMEADIPVLTSVREPYDVAWEEFHCGLAQKLQPNEDSVIAWVDSLVGLQCLTPPARAPVTTHYESQ